MVLQGIDQKTMKMYGIKMRIVDNNYYIYFDKLSTGMFNYEINQDSETYKFKSRNGSIILWKSTLLYVISIF